MKSAGATRARTPEGFCPPLKCHRGIMAKSTRHQTNARATHIFSCLPAGCHQVPAAATTAACASPWVMGPPRPPGSRQRRLGKTDDLDQPPDGVEAEHHREAGEQ